MSHFLGWMLAFVYFFNFSRNHLLYICFCKFIFVLFKESQIMFCYHQKYLRRANIEVTVPIATFLLNFSLSYGPSIVRSSVNVYFSFQVGCSWNCWAIYLLCCSYGAWTSAVREAALLNNFVEPDLSHTKFLDKVHKHRVTVHEKRSHESQKE